MNKGKRDLSLDILRIIACVMVVGIHTAMEGWYNISPRTYTWTVLNIYDTFGRPSIAIFAMISGALFLRRERIGLKRLWLKNILHMFAIYLVWAVFYAVMNNGIHKTLEDPSIIWEVVSGPNPQYHLWYLRMILNMYAVAPLLWFLVRTLDRTHVRYFLILFGAFVILRSTLADLPFLPQWIREQLGLFIDTDYLRYAGYFMLGYYLSEADAAKRLSSKTLLLTYAATLLLAAGLNQLIAVIDDWPTQALYGNFSLPVAVEAICLFLLIRRRYADISFSPKTVSFLARLSASTLFVYLIHPFILQRLQIHLHLYTTNYNVLFSVPLMVLFVFAIGSLCGMLLKRIPLVRYFL